jgi:hypothetical protein
MLSQYYKNGASCSYPRLYLWRYLPSSNHMLLTFLTRLFQITIHIPFLVELTGLLPLYNLLHKRCINV